MPHCLQFTGHPWYIPAALNGGLHKTLLHSQPQSETIFKKCYFTSSVDLLSFSSISPDLNNISLVLLLIHAQIQNFQLNPTFS